MINNIPFFKYHGTGNDFIIINSFEKNIQLEGSVIKDMCSRRFGIGADGLIILRDKQSCDFEMDFYNSDGNKGSMCGNGGRCIVAFAKHLGLINESTTFFAPDGMHSAKIEEDGNVSLKMTDVSYIKEHKLGVFLDTGSPHLVITKKSSEKIDVNSEGKKIRSSEDYKKEGVNVNFLYPNHKLPELFTYERGVEKETYSCGTGTVASALTLSLKLGAKSPISIKTKGGLLTVSFNKISDREYNNIILTGPAIKVFEGTYLK